MRIKNFLKYLCLCGILAILFIVCILVAQASGIGALVTLPLGFVAISLIYGVISYLITNRIIIPQAIHFVAWVLMFTLAVKSGSLIVNSVIIAVIMSISVAVSLLTAFIVKCVKRIETEKIHAHDGKPSFLKKYYPFAIILGVYLLPYIMRKITGYSEARVILFYFSLIFIVPVLCVAFGILSYKLLKKILLPALIFASLDLTLNLVDMAIYERWYEDGVVFLVSIFAAEFALGCVSSLITRRMSRKAELRKKSQTDETVPSE